MLLLICCHIEHFQNFSPSLPTSAMAGAEAVRMARSEYGTAPLPAHKLFVAQGPIR